MTVSYGTAEQGSQEHAGTQLRIASYGPQAVNVSGRLSQTDLHYNHPDSSQYRLIRLDYAKTA